jgi:hypothetical protein
MLMLSACGGGNNTSPDEQNTSTSMTLGKTYTLKDGQKITPKSDDALVELKTDVASGDTTAKLTKGSAVIE